MRMTKRGARGAVAATALAVIAAGALFLANAGAAVLPPVQNTAGEAGYYVQHWNNWHIRDAHATFAVTGAMMHLNGAAGSFPGAVGVELCDPDDGYSAQLGVTFVGGQFEILAAHGNLDTATLPGNDPCVQNGVIVTKDSPFDAAVQLAGSVSRKATNSPIWSSPAGVEDLATPATTPPDPAGGVWAVPVNRSQPGAEQVPLALGDVVTLDLYYNPTSSHGLNSLQFTTDVYSAGGAFLGEDQYTDGRVRPQNFFEAAVGADNTGAPALTAPADLPLVNFSDATFTNYNKSAVDKLNGGWGLTQAQTVNGASQVTLAPTSAVGNSFSVLEGSASP